MTSGRWHEITGLFQQATERAPEERDAWLAETCRGDAELLAAVQALLDADPRAESWYRQAVVDLTAAPLVAEGTKLGPYEIEHLIARGGMGEVYAARDTRLGRAVAVKVLPDLLERESGRRTRFEREARAISSLMHPHICTLYDVGEHDGRMYLVMERLEGQTLAAKIADGPLPVAQTLEISLQIAGALEHAHRLGIIHRDVKPANVMLTGHGAKLLDFGVARGAGAATVGGVPVSPQPVGDSLVEGTPGYMAPEQFSGAAADVRTDIYAFGVILLEMLTGKPAPNQVDDLRAVRPDAPPALQRLVAHCLVADPERRCSDAGQVVAELHGIARSGPRTDVRHGRALARGSAVALLLLGLGAFAWQFAGSRRDTAAETPLTKNRDAHDAYVRAIEYLNTDSERDTLAAITLLEQATQLDPEFTAALAKLGYAHAWLWWQHDHSPARKAQAKQAVDRAVAVDPASPEVRKALAYYDYWCERDFDGALQELALAGQSQPDDPEIPFAAGSILRRRGQVDQSVAPLQKSVALKPRNALYWENLALTYAMLRRPQEMDEALVRATEANPQFPMAHAARAHWWLRLAGDVNKAREVLSAGRQLALGDDNNLTYASILTEWYGGQFDAALGHLTRSAKDEFKYQTWYVPRALLEGHILTDQGSRAAARAAFERAASGLLDLLRRDPDNPRYHSALGLAYAGLGKRQQAINEGEMAVRLEPIAFDSLRGAYRIEDLAQIYAAVGESEAALDRLEYLMSVPHDLGRPGVALNPTWAKLRRHPRFRALVSR